MIIHQHFTLAFKLGAQQKLLQNIGYSINAYIGNKIGTVTPMSGPTHSKRDRHTDLKEAHTYTHTHTYWSFFDCVLRLGARNFSSVGAF